MPMITGGQALVAALKREGVDTLFGLPGIQMDWAFDALYHERDSIRVIHTRHEQATTYMADGYARVTGRPGVAVVVPGPGLLNATAGLATAYACSSPVLCIAGQIQSDLIGRGRGVLHEIHEQLDAVRPVTKWAARAGAPGEIPHLVAEAFRQMRGGRPRPVELEIPPDILQAQVDLPGPAGEGSRGDTGGLAVEGVEGSEGSAGSEGGERGEGLGHTTPDPVLPDPDLLDQAARMLGGAQRPLIFSGGGILSAGAWEELTRLAELLEAPVVMTPNGRGALPDRHPLAQNELVGRELLPGADVVLAVGTRFLQPVAWGIDPGQRVIQMDVDPGELGRNHPSDIALHAHARTGLEALAAAVERHNVRRPSRRDELAALKQRLDAMVQELEPQASLGRAIRSVLPEDGVLVNEMTQVGYWARVGFPVQQPRTFITPGYQGTLGYGFATALGAQVGASGRRVVSINGDGGFMYNVQELSTMVRHRIPAVAVVFNDHAYGNVRRIQQTRFGGRLIASDLHNPDFVKLGESFGVASARVHGAEDLARVLGEMLDSGEPGLIEVPVGEMPSIGHLFGWEPRRAGGRISP